MNKVTNTLLAVILVVCMALCMGVTVSAEVPFESYTYWSDVASSDKSVYNRPMYKTVDTVSAAQLGIPEFTDIVSVSTDKYGNIYILDSNSQIAVFKSEFTLIKVIGAIGDMGYYNAKNLYVYDDLSLYICDKQEHRIIHATQDGELIEIIELPDSPLIPKDFAFNPASVVRDEHGYLYVLSEGSYYGALLYGPDKEFLGFYGANAVKATVSSVFENIKNRIFPNNEKKANTAQRLPYSFVDIDIDERGFIYTCNGYTSASERQGQIRKLSPGTASNILGSGDVNFVDSDINTDYKSGSMAKQNILDVEVDSNGFIYGLESVYGKIFLYDSNCNKLSVFGGGMGGGTQKGTFTAASSIALIDNGRQIIVTDSETNLITIFEITDFGSMVKENLNLIANGFYEEARAGLEALLKEDKNFQPTYAGLARVCLNEENYTDALKYAKLGYDRETYAVAFEYLRSDFINRNFTVLFLGCLIIIGGVIFWLVISKNRKIVIIRNRELGLMFSSLFSPSNTFTEIKEKHYGSVGLSFVLLMVFYIVTILQTLAGGFLFTSYDPASFNSLFILIKSVGLVVLWILSNWLVCTLLGGKGRLREIIIVTCYSLIPLILGKIIRLALTNVLVPTEASFLGILDTVALIYFAFMMIIGLMKIHDFFVSRLVLTTTLSVAGIAAIVFLMIVFVLLVQQLWGFVLTVGSEILSL